MSKSEKLSYFFCCDGLHTKAFDIVASRLDKGWGGKDASNCADDSNSDAIRVWTEN